MPNLSPDQQLALKVILDWYKNDSKNKQFITLGGYAGTGKTTLIATLREALAQIHADVQVGFASYTGKATRVLRNKLLEQKSVKSKDSVSTIHSLMYSPLLDDKQNIVGWQKKESIDKNLIIIDEASMVDGSIWQHLLSYHIPIIAVGDHGQLPPIEGAFNLMAKPEITLTQIHRQARDNPIIQLSIQAREQGSIPCGTYGKNIRKYAYNSEDGQDMMQELLANVSSDTLVLCGLNLTRNRLNKHIRDQKGFETLSPSAGDRVICLRNNHKKHIFNGMLGSIVSIGKANPDWLNAEILMDDEDLVFKGPILATQFGASVAQNFSQQRSKTIAGDLFDFGYAMTVHKAQGSQAKRVILFEERFSKMDDQQWKRRLYTAVTRAETELFIFGPSVERGDE